LIQREISISHVSSETKMILNPYMIYSNITNVAY